jgi:hypothetical protein
VYLKEFQEMEKDPIHRTETAEVDSKTMKRLLGTMEWADRNENCLDECN